MFGLMGSGRTEMVRALFGLAPHAPGAWPGPEARRRRPARVPPGGSREGFGYLSEDRKGEGLALPLSVADNVTLTRLSSCSRGGVLDLAPAARAGRRRGPSSSACGCAGRPSPCARCPAGNQQKAAFARLVHQEADVLLLDEPTRGVDVASKAALYQAIARAADAGRAVLMVSSYVPELLGVCDRVAVMSRGRLSPARPAAEWTPERMLEAAIGS